MPNLAKLDRLAPRMSKVAPTAVVDTKFGEHGGAFALEFGANAKLLADGRVLVCEGPRLLRLTSDGRPDPSFGHGGTVGLGGADIECKDVFTIGSGEAYVQVGRVSALAPTRIMKMSPSGELVELAPERQVGMLATDTEGRLLEIRINKDALFLDTLAPRAESVKLDADAEEGMFQIAFAGRRPLLWRSYFFGTETPDPKLMRFTPNGERDKTFAAEGIFRLPTKCGHFEGVLSLRDRRLVVASAACVALLDANGHLDASFGHDGILELSSEGSPVELPDGRIALAGHPGRTAARLVTLKLQGAKTDTVLLEGPIVSSRFAGIDAHGRALVSIGVHRYVTERTTDQESVMIMTRP